MTGTQTMAGNPYQVIAPTDSSQFISSRTGGSQPSPNIAHTLSRNSLNMCSATPTARFRRGVFFGRQQKAASPATASAARG